MSGEGGAELEARAVDFVLHAGDVPPEDLRDFVVRELLIDAQDERGSSLVVEAREGAVEQRVGLATEEQRFGIGREALGVVRDGLVEQHGLGVGANVLSRDVARDAEQPGKGAIDGDGAHQRCVGAHEGLLRHFVRGGDGAEQPLGESPDARGVLAKELVKRSGVTAARAFEQRAFDRNDRGGRSRGRALGHCHEETHSQQVTQGPRWFQKNRPSVCFARTFAITSS